MNIFKKMYSRSTPTDDVSDDRRDKKPNRVLSGMKVHNTHVKTVEIGDSLVDVPKIEYVSLLEQQVKDLREQNKKHENDIARLRRHLSRCENKIREIEAKMLKVVFKKGNFNG